MKNSSLLMIASTLAVILFVVEPTTASRKSYFVNETYPVVPNTVPIKRVKTMSIEQFHREHTQGDGMPVIFTGLTDDWPARSKWNFDFLKEKYGNKTVMVQRQDESRKKMKMGQYIEYMLGPKTGEDAVHPWYLTNWLYWRDNQAPELADDFTVPNLFKWNLMKYVKPNALRWIFMGAQGSGSAMHSDTFYSSAWLSVLQGRKRWIMYPPSSLSDEAEVDAFYPDKEDDAFADLQARPESGFEGVLHPGEIMFVPPRWNHQVYNIDHTLALTHNYIDVTNMRFVDRYFKEQRGNLNNYEKSVKKQLSKLKKTVGFKKQKIKYADHIKGGKKTTMKSEL